MIKTDELIGIIYARGLSQRKLAKAIGMTETTFYRKMKKGVFNSNEIQTMVEILKIKEPISIFFAPDVAR